MKKNRQHKKTAVNICLTVVCYVSISVLKWRKKNIASVGKYHLLTGGYSGYTKN